MTHPTAMPKDSQPALTPKLRFPEFRNEPGWEQRRLGLVLKFQAGFPFPSSGFNDVGKGLRLIRNRDLRSDDNIVFYSDEFDPSFIVGNGDVLVGMDGDFTPTVWEKGNALLNQRVGRVLPREHNNRRFLLYLLTLCLKRIEEATARTTVKHLSHSAVENKHEPVPSPAEQQKIAECLSTLDELIGAESQKLDALKAHKKGLMQQLFPREGETLPRLRFPEFQNAPEWRERKLDDILESITNGLSAPQNGGVNGIRVTRIETISSQEIDLTKVGFISTDQDVSSYKLQIGDILFSNINSVSHIGKTAFVSQEYDLYHGMNLLRLIVDKAENYPHFVHYLLNTDSVRESFRARANKAVNQASINQTELGRTVVKLPRQDEQHRIATCLSSLDELIAAQSERISALQTHKQGLLQHLFPVAGENA